jgi:hypothetical protein
MQHRPTFTHKGTSVPTVAMVAAAAPATTTTVLGYKGYDASIRPLY